MCLSFCNDGIILLIICFIFIGIIPVAGYDGEDIIVPLEGVTTFKYSPAGYSLAQPDGIMVTVSEFSGHHLGLFIQENQPILSVDASLTNMTLDEIVEAQKKIIEEKDDYAYNSEGETSFAGQSAFFINFTYSDEFANEKQVHEIIAINEGFKYILMSTIDNSTSNNEIIDQMLNSFQFIPMSDDGISKMVRSKMERMNEPSKGYRHLSYSVSNSSDYSWDYYYDWCQCNTSYIDYYCDC